MGLKDVTSTGDSISIGLVPAHPAEPASPPPVPAPPPDPAPTPTRASMEATVEQTGADPPPRPTPARPRPAYPAPPDFLLISSSCFLRHARGPMRPARGA